MHFQRSKNQKENFRQSLTKHLDVLAKLLFTTIETELDYYHQKVNVEVALQVTE